MKRVVAGTVRRQQAERLVHGRVRQAHQVQREPGVAGVDAARQPTRPRSRPMGSPRTCDALAWMIRRLDGQPW